ncbi:uncharacterized protein LOC126215130 [Schistocerca nitens]|uniref:uncharacterized protein LOC126215130 n=1 Tax=Schistocerca nitens TaxID=7011 RepID=UPI00211872A0|nr:uncharacterized protein LOC126215130 [Schistocerca nitens]
MPEPNKDEWEQIAKDYDEKWNYPHCIGALDSKHVQIRCPAGAGSLYYNYKGIYAIVLLALVAANYKFTLVDVAAYGKNSNGGTVDRSEMGKRFESNNYAVPKDKELLPAMELPYVIIADEAFPLKAYLMHPYSKAAITSDEEKVYNYRHSRARRTVENAFGILAGRWRIFLKPIETKPEIVNPIVLASTCLHNMLRNTSTNISPFEDQIRMESEHIHGVANLEPIRRNFVREVAITRDKFKKYFVSDYGSASCPWQWHSIRKGRVAP